MSGPSHDIRIRGMISAYWTARCSAGETKVPAEKYRSLLSYVKDRPGHDRRYAIDCSRLKKELGWKQARSFDEGLRDTVRWYLSNKTWCERVRSGEYRNWLEANYTTRT